MPVYKAPRGTRDILPGEQKYWHYVMETAENICRLQGYGRIDTPVFEFAGLFTRGVGEGTDIVEKEMYTFFDRSGSSLALRPEGTAPVCRSYVEHGMSSLPQPVRLYYLAPAFRYERPQAGRMRQHHQFGFEVIGDGSALVDAEVICLAWQFLKALGLDKLRLVINSIGCWQCRPLYLEKLKNYYQTNMHQLCDDCQVRMDKNPLRLLDCKNESCQPVAAQAPECVCHLCSGCLKHFNQLKDYLSLAGVEYEISHRLVRGLDYYTRTVFEIQPENAGSQGTIGGGGRYDRLIEEIGGRATPAIGFASGIERIILNLQKQAVNVPALLSPQVCLAYAGDAARVEAWSISRDLNAWGLGAVVATDGKSLKAQLRQANQIGARYAVIIGSEELEQGKVVVRDLNEGAQILTDRKNLCQQLESMNMP